MDYAGKALDSLYADYSNDMAIQMLKGKYHLMAWEPAIAMTHFKDVVDKEPNFPLGHYCLGLAHLADGQNQLGFQSLVKALSFDNSFTDAELARADCHHQTSSNKMFTQLIFLLLFCTLQSHFVYRLRRLERLSCYRRRDKLF